MSGQKLYLYKTELFELELLFCIKMDLVLNNLQRLICHKTQTNYILAEFWLYLGFQLFSCFWLIHVFAYFLFWF